VITEGAVEKHVANIFAKLGLPVSESDNRRVLAVLRYLQS
jgi:DNA-binding NarL/FixJ family response regulator